MRVLVPVLLVLALSGCFGSGDGDPDESATTTSTTSTTPSSTSGTPTSTTTTTSSPTTSQGNGSNQAPGITVSAVASGLQVTFTLNLSDADGDPLTWDLQVDNQPVANGTVAGNGTATHETELAAGTHSYVATASDGRQTSTTHGNVTLEAESASQTASGSLVAGVEACGPASAFRQAGVVPLSDGSPTDDVSRASFALDRATIGNAWTLAWTFDVGYIAIYTFFTDAEGTIVAHAWTESPNTGDYEATGTVPDADFVVLFACAGPTQAEWAYAA